MNKLDTVDAALAALEKLTGIGAVIQNVGNKHDGQVVLKRDGKDYNFFTESKGTLTRSMVPLILNRISSNKKQWLLVCHYIPSALKSQLKKEKINYLESAGNCYIDVPGLFVYINDQKVTPLREKPGKLWKETGLKFLFAILTNRQLLNEPYRVISEQAEISLGSVSLLIKELKSQGFAIDALRYGEQIMLLEHESNLIDQWAIVYNSTLRPKLWLGKFKSLLKFDETSLGGPNLYWGGEQAAARITRYLSPQEYTVYSWLRPQEVIKTLKLMPDGSGNIEVISAFWPATFNAQNQQSQSVPSLIVYADLLNSNDSRNREVAKRIKEQKLMSE